VIFDVQNEIGPYGKEKQYSDLAAKKFLDKGIEFKREVRIGESANIVDGIVEGKVLLEFKAKRLLTKQDYYQTQRYLQETGLRLAILVNFRDKYVKPRRIVRIDTVRANISPSIVTDQYHPY
jgi:GxxExxY protein